MSDYCYDDQLSSVIYLLEEISNKLTEIHDMSVFSFNSMAQARNGDIDNRIEALEFDLKLLKKTRREYEQRKKELDSGSY